MGERLEVKKQIREPEWNQQPCIGPEIEHRVARRVCSLDREHDDPGSWGAVAQLTQFKQRLRIRRICNDNYGMAVLVPSRPTDRVAA